MNFNKYVTSSTRKANSPDSVVYYALIQTDFATGKRAKATRGSEIYKDVSGWIARILGVKVATLTLTDQAQFISNLTQAMSKANVTAKDLQALIKA